MSMKTAWIALVATLLPVVANAQSLGEAAAREKERRQKNAEADVKPRVVTDADLKAGSGRLANDPSKDSHYEHASPDSPSTDGTTEASALDEGVSRAATEASWRDRKAQAVAKVEAARQKHKMYSEMWLAPVGEYYVNQKTGERIDSVGQLQGMTAAAKAELDTAEKELADLEETARRANVPPGWLR
jgi:hypothetical protein